MRVSTIRAILILSVLTLLLSACSRPFFWESQSPSSTEQGAVSGPAGSAEAANYKKADRLPPDYAKKSEGCVTAGGREVCGYDCKVVGNYAKCASDPRQRCVVGPTGEIKCGYGCKVTDSTAKCGQYLYDNCVSNSLGEVKCGNNCYEREDGELVCGK